MTKIRTWWSDRNAKINRIKGEAKILVREKITLSELRRRVAVVKTSRDAPSETDTSFLTGRAQKMSTPKLPWARLEYPSHIRSEADLRQQSRADWQGVHPYIMGFTGRMVMRARSHGVPLYAHTAYRDRETQNAAVRAGRSRTRWPDAAHCRGGAVDIVHGRYHWDLTDDEWRVLGSWGRDICRTLGTIGGLNLVWGARNTIGGDWRTMHDPAHWELPNWRGQPIVREGEKRILGPATLSGMIR